jgi:hypothetical protein
VELVHTLDGPWHKGDTQLKEWVDIPLEMRILDVELEGWRFDTYLVMGLLECDIDRKDDFHILDVAYKVRIGRGLKRFRVVLDIVDLGLDLEAIYVC